MLKFQKDMTSSFWENVTPEPDAGQNPGATKIPLPLRAGDKNWKLLYFLFYEIFNILNLVMKWHK